MDSDCMIMKILAMSFCIGIVTLILCIGCSHQIKKTKCVNGLLYEQSDDNPQIYLLVRGYQNACVN